jgi:hypothetical protein
LPLWRTMGIIEVEVVRRLPVVMKEAAMAMPLVAAISCEGGCVVAMVAYVVLNNVCLRIL